MIERIQARRRPAVAGTLATLAAATLAGCGASRPAPHLSAAEAAQMDAHLKVVQRSAGQEDPIAATSALDAFAGDVARAKASGALAPSVYSSLKMGIARARDRIQAEVVAPAATTPLSPRPAAVAVQPAGPPAAKTHGPGKAKGHGHGKGKGDD